MFYEYIFLHYTCASRGLKQEIKCQAAELRKKQEHYGRIKDMKKKAGDRIETLCIV